MLEPGLRAEVTTTVRPDNTAAAVASGSVAVFSTPSMIGLMETAAIQAVSAALQPGQTTVGVVVDVRHLAATPLGFTVTARAELVAVDGRRLVFEVEASDDRERIGEGRHERMIVDFERFMQKTEQKRRA